MDVFVSELILQTSGNRALAEDPLNRVRIFCHTDLTVGVATPSVRVGDISFNERAILAMMSEAVNAGVDILLFSERALTGATCGDLYRHDLLVDELHLSIERVAQATEDTQLTLFLPVPLLMNDKIIKAILWIHLGMVGGLMVSPFELQRVEKDDESIYLFPNRFFDESEVEDLSYIAETETYESPYWDYARHLALYFGNNDDDEDCESFGAYFDLIPDARHEWTGDYRRLRNVLIDHSKSHHSVVLYAGAGEGESVNEGVFAGRRLIVCDGNVLAESRPFTTGLTTAVIRAEDLEAIERKGGSAVDADDACDACARAQEKNQNQEVYERFPFVMKEELDASTFFHETLTIQGQGLRSRLAATGTRPILGLSGGLDSALALLVCLEAAKIGGFSPDKIIAISMPGPGTSEKSRALARQLGEATHVDFREIDITEAVALHLDAIGHDGATHDVTYENAQARERTQILMDLANMERGLVVGTGDLSESALGWCTYNGDHMSMYSVNASVAKTAVRYLVKTAATLFEEGESPVELPDGDKSAISAALREILCRPVSPELLPPHEDGSLRQITEDVVGPYEVIDFFLWHMVFHCKKPSVVYDAAVKVFSDTYDDSSIERWLKGFIRRFFRSQFKRSASPEGVAAFPWRLSPQRAWTMPSDMAPALWLEELEAHLERL
ncbi:MAG: NAD(+) synthase [Saccharofermentanales bacterium]|jgi:NAD+ synthase (glutamine-hydrolysing)